MPISFAAFYRLEAVPYCETIERQFSRTVVCIRSDASGTDVRGTETRGAAFISAVSLPRGAAVGTVLKGASWMGLKGTEEIAIQCEEQ